MSLCSEQKILIVSVGKLNEGCFVQPSEMHLLLLTLIIFSSLCLEQYRPLVSLGKLKKGTFKHSVKKQ